MDKSSASSSAATTAARRILFSLVAVRRFRRNNENAVSDKKNKYKRRASTSHTAATCKANLDAVLERRLNMLRIASLDSADNNDTAATYTHEYSHVRNNWARFIGFPMQYLLLVCCCGRVPVGVGVIDGCRKIWTVSLFSSCGSYHMTILV